MKRRIVYLLVLTLTLVSCNSNKKAPNQVIEKNKEIAMVQNTEGYDLLKTKCYACHNPNTPSHDNLIAPPMAAIKMRYKMQFDNQDSFVKAITEWATNPEADKAKMRGAVAQFNVMPKQDFNEEDIRKIATYMFENELEQPEWFASHEKEMHKGNRRGGMGMGRKN